MKTYFIRENGTVGLMGGQVTNLNQQEREVLYRNLRKTGREAYEDFLRRKAEINRNRDKNIGRGVAADIAKAIAGREILIAKAKYSAIGEIIRQARRKLHEYEGQS